MAFDFEKFVKYAITKEASDIHLSTGNFPSLRIDGKINHYDENGIMDNEEVEASLKKIMSDRLFCRFSELGELDFAAEYCGSRFRVNAFKQRFGSSFVMRIIRDKIPELSSLNLPGSLERILDLNDGLVLVTGPTGSGKSTTLAAIINELNKKTAQHIITIENPVEYIHKPISCIVNQREVGEDTTSFASALRNALREDPDIILLGEMRDNETASIALSAAETGHLVFSTLHTEGAAKSIDRLVDMFPSEQQRQVLGQISTSLRAIVSQRLLPCADGNGRIGAFEIMFATSAVSNLIRENKIAQIDQVIETGYRYGMNTFKSSVEDLYKSGIISSKTAKKYLFDMNDINEYKNSNSFSIGKRVF